MCERNRHAPTPLGKPRTLAAPNARHSSAMAAAAVTSQSLPPRAPARTRAAGRSCKHTPSGPVGPHLAHDQAHHVRAAVTTTLAQQLSASWQRRRCVAARCTAAAAAAARPSSPAPADEDEGGVSYSWSWQQRGMGRLSEQPTQFDTDHPLPAQPSLQDVMALLQHAAGAWEAHDAVPQQAAGQEGGAAGAAEPAGVAAAAAALPSQPWLSAVLAAAQPQLQAAAPAGAVELLQLLSQLDVTPDAPWMDALLTHTSGTAGQLQPPQVAALVWALSNLQHTPSQQQWSALLVAGQRQLQDFYGPDLALFVCGAGSIYSSSSASFDPSGGVRAAAVAAAAAAVAAGDGSDGSAGGSSSSSSSSGSCTHSLSLPPGWADAVLAEVGYQVTQFPADLGAFDLARLASGLADLAISPSAALAERLLKAVYMRTRTIEEKAAVDFALAKLDASGKRSMHYDPRWTHKELKWLPRRERDKRRLIKEGWYRTQWGGWSS